MLAQASTTLGQSLRAISGKTHDAVARPSGCGVETLQKVICKLLILFARFTMTFWSYDAAQLRQLLVSMHGGFC